MRGTEGYPQNLSRPHRANRKNAMDHTNLRQRGFETLAKLYAEEIFSTTDARVLVDWLNNDRGNSVGDDIDTFSTLPAETYYVEFYLEELIRENLPYERMGKSHRANHKVARDWEDTIDELLWHFDALYGEVGDDSVRDFLWGNDSFGLQYEFDAFMKSAPPSVREKAMRRVKTMFKFLKTSHRANRKTANRANEQQEKDFTNPARELTSVDYGESHDGSYYMSFGLGSIPNAVMVRIGDDELERVLEGLGHYYSFSADGYSFDLSFDKWYIWDHNGNGGFTLSDEAMTVVHDGLFEIFLRGGMPHTSSRKRAYDGTDLLLDFLNGDMSSDSYFNTVSPGPHVEEAVKAIFNEFDPHDVDAIYDWYYGKNSPYFQDALNDYAYNGGIELGLLESLMREMIEHNLPV